MIKINNKITSLFQKYIFIQFLIKNYNSLYKGKTVIKKIQS